jgi:hypothetical protein
VCARPRPPQGGPASRPRSRSSLGSGGRTRCVLGLGPTPFVQFKSRWGWAPDQGLVLMSGWPVAWALARGWFAVVCWRFVWAGCPNRQAAGKSPEQEVVDVAAVCWSESEAYGVILRAEPRTGAGKTCWAWLRCGLLLEHRSVAILRPVRVVRRASSRGLGAWGLATGRVCCCGRFVRLRRSRWRGGRSA